MTVRQAILKYYDEFESYLSVLEMLDASRYTLFYDDGSLEYI